MTTRRRFLRSTAGVGAGAALGIVPAVTLGGAPAVHIRRITPVAVGSTNGREAVAKAIEVVQAGGDTLDAVIHWTRP